MILCFISPQKNMMQVLIRSTSIEACLRCIRKMFSCKNKNSYRNTFLAGAINVIKSCLDIMADLGLCSNAHHENMPM